MKCKVYQSSINLYYNEIYIENELRNINETIDLFNKLIKDNEIPFNEYIDIINRIYKVKITNNDLYRISSIILGGTCKSVILDTDMIFEVTRKLEYNGKFEYLDEEDNLFLKVAFTDDSVIDTTCKYSSKEIRKMIDDKKIVLLEFVLDYEDDNYLDYEYNGMTPMNSVIFNNFTNFKYIREDYIPAVMMYLKRYFTRERLKNDFSYYINDLKLKLDVLDYYIQNIQVSYNLKLNKFNNITCECNKIRERKISKDI